MVSSEQPIAEEVDEDEIDEISEVDELADRFQRFLEGTYPENNLINKIISYSSGQLVEPQSPDESLAKAFERFPQVAFLAKANKKFAHYCRTAPGLQKYWKTLADSLPHDPFEVYAFAHPFNKLMAHFARFEANLHMKLQSYPEKGKDYTTEGIDWLYEATDYGSLRAYQALLNSEQISIRAKDSLCSRIIKHYPVLGNLVAAYHSVQIAKQTIQPSYALQRLDDARKYLCTAEGARPTNSSPHFLFFTDLHGKVEEAINSIESQKMAQRHVAITYPTCRDQAYECASPLNDAPPYQRFELLQRLPDIITTTQKFLEEVEEDLHEEQQSPQRPRTSPSAK